MAREQRKLAAILAADGVGYSRLMGRDESGTLAQLPDIKDCSSLMLRSGSAYIPSSPVACTRRSPMPDKRALLAGYDQ